MAQHRQYTKYILLQHYKHQRYGIYYRDVVAHRACVCVCVCLYSTAAAPKQKKNTEKNLRAAEVEAVDTAAWQLLLLLLRVQMAFDGDDRSAQRVQQT